MFLPAIILAIYRHLYIEALIYFFNMFFSTVISSREQTKLLTLSHISLQFYHACDQDINKFCIFKYDGLQLSDFIGSYASFIVTLVTMAIIPRSVKAFLFVLGLLTCIIINSRDRFDHMQFIGLISVAFSFTVATWVRTRMEGESVISIASILCQIGVRFDQTSPLTTILQAPSPGHARFSARSRWPCPICLL